MLPSKYRLTVTEFNRNKSLPLKYQTSLFIFLLKKSSLLFNRFTVIVSKRIDKRAVYRNQSKRAIHNIIYMWLAKMGGGHDILIRPKKIIKHDDELTRRELEQFFTKNNLVNR